MSTIPTPNSAATRSGVTEKPQLTLDFSQVRQPLKQPVLPKRQAKSEFKALLAQASARGLSASTSYCNLKKAKDFAAAQGLDFPVGMQQLLSQAARKYLAAYLGTLYSPITS